MVGVGDSETGLPSFLPSSSGSITTWGQQRPSIAPRAAPMSSPNLNNLFFADQSFPGFPPFPVDILVTEGEAISTALSFLSLPWPGWRSAAAKNTSSPTTVLLKGFIFPCLKFQIPPPVFCLFVVFENRDLMSF